MRTERKIHKQRILLTLISLQVCLFAQPTVTAKSPPTNAQNVSASTSLPVASLNDLTVNTVDYVAADKISMVGTEHDGTDVTKSFVYGTAAGHLTST